MIVIIVGIGNSNNADERRTETRQAEVLTDKPEKQQGDESGANTPALPATPPATKTPALPATPLATKTPALPATKTPANTIDYTFANGVTYDGKTYYGIMSNGKPDVYGALFNEKTGFFYLGGFKDGKYHTYGYDAHGADKSYGQAVLKLENGQRYYVDFKDGKQYGPGWFYDSDDKVYEATWKEGKPIVDLSYYKYSDMI